MFIKLSRHALAVAVIAPLPVTAVAHPDPQHFAPTAFRDEPAIVDCTLENGTETTCYELTLGYQPKDLRSGPSAPPTWTKPAASGIGTVTMPASIAWIAHFLRCWPSKAIPSTTRMAT